MIQSDNLIIDGADENATGYEVLLTNKSGEYTARMNANGKEYFCNLHSALKVYNAPSDEYQLKLKLWVVKMVTLIMTMQIAEHILTKKTQ